MREYWVNVYPGIDVGGGHYLGVASVSREEANDFACDCADATPDEVRAAGVGYRLHVRLKPEEYISPARAMFRRLAGD